ncbi:MAG: GNAT family N-acetyltransferase [Betaproteobacteria bacterium]|nr:MAG: GNAT family N-acetyltransferase [Betaproteobacteria bacterium]
MATRTPQQTAGISLRRTKAEDMQAVVALDATIVDRPRQFYFQRRLKAALDQTELHVQFSAEQDGRIVGFIKARRLKGEFGHAEPALRLETIAVAPGEQGQGVGRALLSRLEDEAKRMGVAAIRTSASWREHTIMQFFDRAGFEFAHNLVLDCPTKLNRVTAHERDNILAPAHVTGFSATEVDYSALAANDFDALAQDRFGVRALEPGDFADIVRIDQRVSGHRREDYIRELFDEAMTDSAVRVSLVACVDGIAAGFVMARTDFGDYGRAQPVAVLDTIGVDPDYAHRGVGHALLSQLFVNLAALRVERVETMVTREDFGLLGFFYDAGFGQSQRLSFDKRVA